MNEVATLLHIMIVAGGVAGPMLLLIWVLAGEPMASLTDLFASSRELPWPRGVQEEEPQRWDIERLHAPGSRPVAAPCRPETVAVDRGRVAGPAVPNPSGR